MTRFINRYSDTLPDFSRLELKQAVEETRKGDQHENSHPMALRHACDHRNVLRGDDRTRADISSDSCN